MTSSDSLEVTGRFVAWQINNYDISCPSIKSNGFTMGKWIWHLDFKPTKKSITLTSNHEYGCKQGLQVPIVSVVFRMLYQLNGLPNIGRAELTDAKFLHGQCFGFGHGKSSRHYGIPFTFSLEFLDLKVIHENDDRSYSIWNEEYPETNSLIEPLNRMLSETIYTDIVITTMDGSIEAHRAVLAASSPIFRTMFSNNYTEKETSTINITDMSIEACKAMVNFIYGKRTSNELRAHAMELMLAADKYDIMDLKKECVTYLCDNVRAKNVFEKLKCASMFGLRDLKSTCLFYLVKMGTIYELQDDYSSFLREADRELIVDVSNAYLYPQNPFKEQKIEASQMLKEDVSNVQDYSFD